MVQSVAGGVGGWSGVQRHSGADRATEILLDGGRTWGRREEDTGELGTEVPDEQSGLFWNL